MKNNLIKSKFKFLKYIETMRTRYKLSLFIGLLGFINRSRRKEVFWMNTKSVRYLCKCFNGGVDVAFFNSNNLNTWNTRLKSQLALGDPLLFSKFLYPSTYLINNFFFVQRIHIAKMTNTDIYLVSYMLLFTFLVL